MKNRIYIFFALSLLASFSAFAQPVITAVGVTPVVCDAFKVQYATTTKHNAPTIRGANLTWDYSTILDSNFTQTSRYINPLGLGLPGSDSFPNATLAAFDATDAIVGYLNPTSSSLGMLGEDFYGVGSLNKFTPQRTLYFFPATYQDSFTDSFTYINPQETDGYTVEGYDTLVVDSYGTLILPNATYDSVLREKVVTTLKYYYTGYAQPVLIVSQTNYEFGLNGFHGPLLELTENSLNPGVWGADYMYTYPLPLTISGFDVSWQNKMPCLQWDAANTENTKQFNIQRSEDGHTFYTVGQVGVGGGSSYNYLDNYIPTSTVYYRLQQLDKDGKTFYSATAQLTVNSKQLSVYPNPSRGTIHVSVPSDNQVYLMIYDIAGKLLYENKTYFSTQPIATDSWGKGTYLVRVKDNDGWKGSSFEINW